MPVFVVRNQAHGNVAYSNLSEGIGTRAAFRCQRTRRDRAPPLDRNRAGADAQGRGARRRRDRSQSDPGAGAADGRRSAQPQRRGEPPVPRGDRRAARRRHSRSRAVRETLEFIAGNSQFFLNLSMASAKAIMDRRARHRRVQHRHRDRAQRRVDGDPRQRPRQRMVRGAVGHAGRAVLPRLRPGRTPTRIWATARSARRQASAALRWRLRRRWCNSSAAPCSKRSRYSREM